MENTEDIKQIEQEIGVICTSDKSSWVRLYELMDEVKEKALWRATGAKSYTAWVNGIADRYKIHVSVLWKRSKAGSVYAKYEERKQQMGAKAVAMRDLKISPDSIELCHKIAGSNTDIEDQLMDKVVAGDLTRDDLRSMAREVHAKRQEKGLKAYAANGYEAHTHQDESGVAGLSKSDQKNILTAAAIKQALNHHSDWVRGEDTRDDDSISRYEKRKKIIYRTLDEFDVNTGESHHVRRIDTMAIENITTGFHRIVLRGIEIKVDVNDLKRDEKMAEYAQYCDYFYVAIPDDQTMIHAAEDYVLDKWGILTVTNDGTVNVYKSATRFNPDECLMREDALEETLIRIL